jgi:hypothetical protein
MSKENVRVTVKIPAGTILDIPLAFMVREHLFTGKFVVTDPIEIFADNVKQVTPCEHCEDRRDCEECRDGEDCPGEEMEHRHFGKMTDNLSLDRLTSAVNGQPIIAVILTPTGILETFADIQWLKAYREKYTPEEYAKLFDDMREFINNEIQAERAKVPN